MEVWLTRARSADAPNWIPLALLYFRSLLVLLASARDSATGPKTIGASQ